MFGLFKKTKPESVSPTLRSPTNFEHTKITGSEEYSFCEPTTAVTNLWHIRKLDETGKHITGGITTSSLCYKVKGPDGFDVIMDITRHHLTHCCKDCATIFRSEVVNKD